MIIMEQQFINRKEELKFLESKYDSNKPELILIYGRRRVGKTELIKKFINGKKNAIYFLVTNEGIKENIKQFRNTIAETLKIEYFKDLDIENFNRLFYYLAKELKERTILVIDEFPYLIENDRTIISQFQKIWDEYLKDKNILLILMGSSIGLMNELMNYKSPLYGRRTGQYEINPLSLIHLKEYFNVDFEELIKIYAIIGGVPAYFTLLNPEASLDEIVKEKIIKKGEFLFEEPIFLLTQEFRETRIYLMILKYIALGYNTFGKLNGILEFDKGNISKYLYRLEQLKLIETILPIGRKKGGIYRIKDYFFNFWFRFVYPNKKDLELGLVNGVFNRIKKEFNSFFGRVFENIILELLETKQINIKLDFTKIGRWWHKDKEIDIVAVDEFNNEILFGECKWKSNVDAKKILKELKEKAKDVQWNNETRKEKYAIFAKSFKTKTNQALCIDLKKLERKIREKIYIITS